MSVAKKFQNKKLPFIDLVQEGNMGLMKAVHRFDHRRGFRFHVRALVDSPIDRACNHQQARRFDSPSM